MRVAIMQPYLLPYLGYVNLLHAVDRFVVLDDVNYIKRGWINRNRFLVDGEARFLTLPIERASQNRLINEHRIFEPERSVPELGRRLREIFRHHPDVLGAGELVCSRFDHPSADLTGFLVGVLDGIIEACDLETEVCLASALGVDRVGSAQDRILALVRRMEGTTYVNLPGGRDLYDRDAFEALGVDLRFIEPHLSEYGQLGAGEFVPGLSILDVLFNVASRTELDDQLTGYDLGDP